MRGPLRRLPSRHEPTVPDDLTTSPSARNLETSATCLTASERRRRRFTRTRSRRHVWVCRELPCGPRNPPRTHPGNCRADPRAHPPIDRHHGACDTAIALAVAGRDRRPVCGDPLRCGPGRGPRTAPEGMVPARRPRHDDQVRSVAIDDRGVVPPQGAALSLQGWRPASSAAARHSACRESG